MNAQQVARMLDDCLRAEQHSLLPRLAQCAVFLSWASADEHYAARQMVSEEQEHMAWLVNMINELGETPTPAHANIRTTSLHFVELQYVMPQIVQDKQQLVRSYETASGRLAGNTDATQLLNKIVTRHRMHLETLQAIARKAAKPEEVKTEE